MRQSGRLTVTGYEFTTGARGGAGCADTLRALSRADGYYCDQDAVLRGILGLQGLSYRVGGACDRGLAGWGVGLRGDTLWGLRGGDDDSGVYGVRVAMSRVRGGVQSGVPETLWVLFWGGVTGGGASLGSRGVLRTAFRSRGDRHELGP